MVFALFALQVRELDSKSYCYTIFHKKVDLFHKFGLKSYYEFHICNICENMPIMEALQKAQKTEKNKKYDVK